MPSRHTRPPNYGTLDARPITRTRAGQLQIRLACSRCETVRWLAAADVGAPHCAYGTFLYTLKHDAGARRRPL